MSLIVNGNAIQNEILTASLLDDYGNETITDGSISYSWLRNGNVIDGANVNVYKLTQDDVGANISAEINYSFSQLVSDGYFEYRWVESGYNDSTWVDSGYTASVWVESGYYDSTWVDSGYTASVWVESGYNESTLISDGYYEYSWDDWWGSYEYWVDPVYENVWIDTSGYQDTWIDTSGYQDTWIDTSGYVDTWIDTSGNVDTWVNTSDYQSVWVDPLYETVTGSIVSSQTNAVIDVNDAPTFTKFSAAIVTGNEDSQIALSFTDLIKKGNEADIDGSVTAFDVKSVSSGGLKIGLSATTATAWNASSNHIIDAKHQAYWTPDANVNGFLNAFKVLAKDNGGLTSTSSVQAKVTVTAVNDAPTGGVSVSGKTIQNQVLTASNTLADADGLGVVVYQWQSAGKDIKGAIKNTYTLTQSDVGKAITVKASYVDGQGTTETVLSKATALIDSNQKPGISFTNVNKLVTTEAGGLASYGVSLTAAPRHDVVLTLSSNDATEGVFSSTLKSTQIITFTPTNWSQVQTISLKGVDDKLVDGDMSYVVSTVVSSSDLRYDGMRSGTGLAISNIVALNADDDEPDEIYGDKGGNAIADYLIGGNGASDIYGLLGRDELYGGNGDDRLYGGYGDDVLYGEADNDELEGEQGNDKLYGGVGNDSLTGGTGKDTLLGGDGNDVIDGSTDADSMDGGNGADTYYVDNAKDVVSDGGTDVGVDTVNIASYISATFKYTLGVGIENASLTEESRDTDLTGNLSNNSLNGNSFDNLIDGGVGTDTLNGGAGNDNLSGGLGDDQLLGGIGADNLTAGTGNDVLNGGANSDNLTGGVGSDVFDFNAITETVIGKGHDSVTDFTHSQADKIDLKDIDANSKLMGDQAFSYLGAKNFDGVAGEVRYVSSILSGDVNGDRVADFEIAITLVGATSLMLGDFVL